MARIKSQYTCNACGSVSAKWSGKCLSCGEWNTLIESEVSSSGNRFSVKRAGIAQTSPVISLADIDAVDVPRVNSGINEFDRVLGGGLVPGGVILIGGDPGIGKSTLLLQILVNLSDKKKTLYISGEESGAQVALRAKRLGLQDRKSVV